LNTKTKNIIIVSVVIIAIIAVIIGIVIATSGGKSESPQKYLDLGNHYLLELDYEQALVQFERIIEIDPKNPAGYIGTAKAYIGLGEEDKAIEILQNGLNVTGDEDIRRMLKELSAPPATEQPVTTTTASTTTATTTSATTTEATTTETTTEETTTVITESQNQLQSRLWDELSGYWGYMENGKLSLGFVGFTYSYTGDERLYHNGAFFTGASMFYGIIEVKRIGDNEYKLELQHPGTYMDDGVYIEEEYMTVNIKIIDSNTITINGTEYIFLGSTIDEASKKIQF